KRPDYDEWKDLPENQEQVEKIEATFPLKTYTYEDEEDDY
ncbi:uncharacterized protein METZ01_LOCUS301333, partial [marine metagenome]